MLFLISICAAGTISLLLVGVTMKSERAIIQERMVLHSQGMAPSTTAIESDMELPFRERVVLPFLRRLASLAASITPAGAIQAAEEKLDAAGRPWRLGGKEFVGLKVLSIGVFVVLAIVGAKYVNAGPFARLALFILLLVVGMLIPEAVLGNVASKRQAAIRRVLPDTLDLLLVSVEAGLGLDGAIQKVVEKLESPLSDELSMALQEMQLGKRRAEALRDMADRVKVPELSSFVAAIIQADQLGVSVSKVLHVQSETVRTARSIRAREAAAKLPVKMLVPLVFCIFPALFVVVLSPGAVRIAKAMSVIAK